MFVGAREILWEFRDIPCLFMHLISLVSCPLEGKEGKSEEESFALLLTLSISPPPRLGEGAGGEG